MGGGDFTTASWSNGSRKDGNFFAVYPRRRVAHHYSGMYFADSVTKMEAGDPSLSGVTPMLDAVFRQLLEQGLQYFISNAQIEVLGAAESAEPVLACHVSPAGAMEFDWLGSRYKAQKSRGDFSESEVRMVKSIGRVLATRYRLAFHPVLAAEGAHLFRGLPEDRYVSAFLNSAAYRDADEAAAKPDKIAAAIEVLRLSAMTTYENRRISTGVILFGTQRDACHALPGLPEGALRYALDLTSTRSFHRLSDGLKRWRW